MAISEGRLPMITDAPLVLKAQQQTARAIDIDAWTAAQAQGIRDNIANPRGQYGMIVAPTAPDGSAEGFMLTDRDRAQPPEPDPTLVVVRLVASLILGDGNDRPRFRRVCASTFKALTRVCHVFALQWQADFPPVVGSAVGQYFTDMRPQFHGTVAMLPNGWTRVRSADLVQHPDAMQWRS